MRPSQLIRPSCCAVVSGNPIGAQKFEYIENEDNLIKFTSYKKLKSYLDYHKKFYQRLLNHFVTD